MCLLHMCSTFLKNYLIIQKWMVNSRNKKSIIKQNSISNLLKGNFQFKKHSHVYLKKAVETVIYILTWSMHVIFDIQSAWVFLWKILNDDSRKNQCTRNSLLKEGKLTYARSTSILQKRVWVTDPLYLLSCFGGRVTKYLTKVN